MSEEKKENKEYYCKWCDTLTNSIVKELENGRLKWQGCPDCYNKKKGVKEE